MTIFEFIKKIRIAYLKQIVWRKYQIGNNFHCGRNVFLWAKNRISIGNNFYIGRYSHIECDSEIGDNIIIGNNVAIIGKYDHNFEEVGVPIRLSSQIRNADYKWKGNNLKVIIEDDVWIGYGTIILSGVKIGQGSIIAAGSLIVKDVEPYSIYAGHPAKKIRDRFDNKEVETKHIELYNINYKKSKLETIKIMGFTILNMELNNIVLSKKSLLTTISPNSYGISTKDLLFCESLKESDYLVLDGVYFALASILLQGKNIKRNQGPDVFYHFMKRMNDTHGEIFFLGSSQKTLEKIKDKAAIEYPNIKIEYYSPPYKTEFSDEDNEKMIEAVNKFEPDILFVGMTCPKQEKWSYQNKEKLNTKLICCIGGVFDWYAGNLPEIAPIWWKLRLGWLKRTIDRPEIFKRNIPNIMIFIKHLFLALIGIKKYRNGTI